VCEPPALIEVNRADAVVVLVTPDTDVEAYGLFAVEPLPRRPEPPAPQQRAVPFDSRHMCGWCRR
jgi:hypothetical protein